MEGKLTIGPVVKRRLCMGCGTCAAICPQDAIEMVAHRRKGCCLPRLDKERCTGCGLCHQVCPGHGVDFESFNDELFGDAPEDIAPGRYLGCYVGHALDRNVRHDCACGGLVSALLVFALEEGLIDGALVTRMRKGNPPRPEPFIARTREEILSAAGPGHCPVTTGTVLNEVLCTDGRFAVVGLPCHIQGLRKAERHIPWLRERIRYRISVPCSLHGSFRGTGHPVPLGDSRREPGPNSLRRCTLCSDLLGELSDLTCGDASVPEAMRTGGAGGSFVVSRTAEAEELLEAAASKEAVELSELDLRGLPVSRDHILFKKRKLQARIQMFEWAGRSVPVYRQKLPAPIRGDSLDALKFYAARYALSENRRIIGGLFRLVGSLKRGGSNSGPVRREALSQAVEHQGSK